MDSESGFLVLVVTGVPATARTVTTYLKVRGYRCAMVHSLTEAMEWLESSTPHILLVDLDLPGADGLDLISRIRTDCDLSQVIAMSTETTIDRIIDAYRQGASDYLPMPFKNLNIIGAAVADATARLVKWRALLETSLAGEDR